MNLMQLFNSPIFLKFRNEQDFMEGVPDLNFLCTLFDEIAHYVSKESLPSKMNFPVVLVALDQYGAFLSLSSATLPLLGYHWIELMKKHSSILLQKNDSHFFLNLLSQHKPCKSRTTLIKKDCTTLESLWNLAWSQEEQCFLGTIQALNLDMGRIDWLTNNSAND